MITKSSQTGLFGTELAGPLRKSDWLGSRCASLNSLMITNCHDGDPAIRAPRKKPNPENRLSFFPGGLVFSQEPQTKKPRAPQPERFLSPPRWFAGRGWVGAHEDSTEIENSFEYSTEIKRSNEDSTEIKKEL